MTRREAGRDLLLALTALATVWTAVLAWRGFTENPGRYLEPLLVVGLVVAVVGSAARALGAPGGLVVAAQALVAGLGGLRAVTGSWVPGPDTLAAGREVLAAAVDSAGQYAAPVPGGVPPVEPLLLVAGIACLFVVDVVACTLRRVSLTGLPLLTIYTLPVSMLGGTVPWWVFVLPAVGFTWMLYQHTAAVLDHWDRPASATTPAGAGASPEPDARRGGTGLAALAIGATATGLALVVPLAVPTLGLTVFDGPGGGGGDDEISLDNPMTDMVRDLQRPEDTPFLRVTTDADPAYLRISVLNRFSDDAWTSGDRDLPDSQLADGPQPAPEGVSEGVPRTTYDWRVEVEDEFASTWLPTPFPLDRIQAEGEWKYDLATRDFIAADDGLTTAGLEYYLSSVQLDLSAEELAASAPGSAAVGEGFTELPDDLTPVVGELAREVTTGRENDFARAVALQDWFRSDGDFTYSLDAPEGNGADSLERFLDAGSPEGRTGYCEQFASAMAVMARELGMPARVAVGFLQPEVVGESGGSQVYEFSSSDLHAWPEIYFPGAGWVRFEPTPPDRAAGVPAYTRGLEQPGGEEEPVPGPDETEQPEPNPVPRGTEDPTASPVVPATGVATAGADPWRVAAVVVGAGVLPVLLLVGLLVAPGLLRRRRRARRRRDSAPVEAAWAEVADTVVDLGGRWPGGRSPAATRAELLPALAPAPPDVARRGAEALDRLVADLEVGRYSRDGAVLGDPAAYDAEVAAVTEALAAAATPRARTWARWFPRSLVVRTTATAPVTGDGSTTADKRRTVVETLG